MDIIDGGVTAPRGFNAGGTHCGIIKQLRPDLALVVSEEPCPTFIGLTRNRFKAAPVTLLIDRPPPCVRAIVINSGSANALTGDRGYADAEEMAQRTGDALNIDPEQVVVASTGVIGRFLPMDQVRAGIDDAAGNLGNGREYAAKAAQAIMTTDTFSKEAACRLRLADGTDVSIGGMAKGVGMIAPDMKALHATTISVITTDAVLTPAFVTKWQDMLDGSFNMVSVDGDQSTNDTSLLMANGVAGSGCADEDPAFVEGLNWVMCSLARMLAKDGEGATKLIELKIVGAVDVVQARAAARTIVSSCLVKSAVFGADPNYGRLFMALGNSGAEFNKSALGLIMGDDAWTGQVIKGGVPLQDEGMIKLLEQAMHSSLINMVLDLGVGNAEAKAWGCDLTYEYVRINAEYTT